MAARRASVYVLYTLCMFVATATCYSLSPGVFFSNLGGSGSYKLVTNMTSSPWPPPCSSDQHCFTQTKNIASRNLAPFDEEVSLQLRGPMNIAKIAIYQPVLGGFQRVSYWEQGNPQAAFNISFLGLYGDWDVCNGNALGYATADGTALSATPQILNGYLPPGVQITVLSGVPCKADFSDCDWFRGVGLHGWGGDKIFVVEATMPHALSTPSAADDLPAIWSLNAHIVRTAQYGCNCDRYGCGEFDIAEVLTSGDTGCYITLYSYNGALGTQAYFPRPVSAPTVFLTHYSITDNRIYNLNLPEGCFSYENLMSSSYISNLQSVSVSVDAFLSSPNTNNVFNCSAPILPTTAPTVAATTAPTTTQAPATTQAPTTQLPPTTTTAKPTQPPTTPAPTTAAPSQGSACNVQCGAGLQCCGYACYQPSMYGCNAANQLCQLGTPNCGSPVVTPAPTSAPTTSAPTTSAPSTTVKAVPTLPPSTAAPSTAAPTTTTTVKPTTTIAPTTVQPTVAPTTIQPTTTIAASTTVKAVPTSQPSTISPTTVAPTSTPTTVQQVTSAACGSLQSCGSACYNPQLYSCNSGVLCPVSLRGCGQACYDSSQYTCVNNQLVPTH